MFRNSRFDKLLAKATSELLMEADWETNLTICDMVRGQEVTPKEAVTSLKRKLTAENPHVLMLGLSVLEALMKNCGTPVHDEVCGTDFVMSLLEYTYQTEEIRSKIFGFIQNWEYAFKKIERYSYLHEAYEEIKRSGYSLPPFHESEAMFSAEVAPDWKDGEECYRCKTAFTTFRRKHHCRNCGNVFCGDCTTGRAGIPKYGIEKEVRVCDVCLNELNLSTINGSNGNARKGDRPKLNQTHQQHYQEQQQQQQQQRLHQQQKLREKAARAAQEELRLREEEELQLALALSASEAESKQQQQQPMRPAEKVLQSQPQPTAQKQPPGASLAPTLPSDLNSELATEVDPDLALYLNRNYWAGRAANADGTESYLSGFSPSAPAFPPPVNPEYVPSVVDTTSERGPDLERSLSSVEVPPEGSVLPGVPLLTTPKTEEFLAALKKSLDVFGNRMRVCSQRGRPVTADSTLQTLFKTLHQMNIQLLQYSADLETRRTCLEKVQDQTVQIREAREALNALRNDYAEQRRREEEEAHRQRQILMMQKVEILRQQKRDAVEAQNRQLMEQSMAYQQQYAQYTGYGQQMYPAMVPPVVPYGAAILPPPAMGYVPPPPADYYAAQQPYDPQQPQPQIQPSTQLQPPGDVGQTNVPSTNSSGGGEQQTPMAGPAPEQKRVDSFNMQNMIQAMPAPTQPRVEYAQPGGPPPNPDLLEQMPNPPAEEMPSTKTKLETSSATPESGLIVTNGEREPPSPQLISLE
ncbi:hypothetical protein Aperf_G00000082485 [Anoplocephala perfoliata]